MAEYFEGTTGLRVFREWREYLNPLLRESRFKETGVLTPEEFVLAGDFLVYKCPTWAWSKGLPNKRKDFLPADKQYLITRNVPCLKRIAALEYKDGDEEEVEMDSAEDDDAWVATHKNRVIASGREAEDIADMDEADPSADQQKSLTANLAHLSIAKKEDPAPAGEEIEDLEDIPDMDEELEIVDMEEEEDPAAMSNTAGADDKFVRTRTYDMSITYDKYYQTPRVFLFGYDENRNPLTPVQIFQDISQDHAKKTVTIESHPHESLSLASIHPCKHGNVMKRLIDQMVESGKEELRVDQYLLLFLKFMSSVLPTMEYDYTGDGF
ncbi:Arabinose-proton symporter (Arabinose transporter) [Chytriomyces hyalinus]|nr:Arabinose-proton symporter (Arabinose transporter) [Chytriomyces hyalinus]